MGQFQADIGVQLIGGDFVEQMVIKLGGGAGFIGVRDVLAQIVDGDAGAEFIHGGGGAYGVRNLCAGDEAGGSALAKAGAFDDRAQRAALRQRKEKRPQHDAPQLVHLIFAE